MEFTNVKSNDELMRAQTELCAHVFNHIDSMSLKCAVELGIPDAIHGHGKPITISELLSKLSISPTKTAYMRRLMHMLTHLGIFMADDDAKEELYSLTPLSSILVKNGHPNLSDFVVAMLHPVLMNPFQSLGAWFKGDEATSCDIQYGCSIWDLTARDPKFNKVFNEGMASDAKFIVDVLLKDCKHVFEGNIHSLIDVGGGTGTTAIAISEAFPNIQCSVLDLPQVVNAAEKINSSVDFIAGDMFEYILPVDVVLLKWILHDWNDEDCVKILKRCKEAISSKKDGRGKVIIIEQVTGSNNTSPKSKTSQLYWDMMMLTLLGAAERTEQEWKKIFTEAGFNNYKVTPVLGLRSVIELYP